MDGPVWLPTRQAAEYLGRGRNELLAAAQAGLFTPGVHYLKGRTSRSPFTWNIPLVLERYASLARMPAATGSTTHILED